MSIDILSPDETQLEHIDQAMMLHADKDKIVVLLHARFLSKQAEQLLDDDEAGLSVYVNGEWIKTATHYIQTSYYQKTLAEGQWLIIFYVKP